MSKRMTVLLLAMALTVALAFTMAWQLPWEGGKTIWRLRNINAAETWGSDFIALEEEEDSLPDEEDYTPEEVRGYQLQLRLPLFSLILCGGWSVCLLVYWLTAQRLYMERITFASIMLIGVAMICLKPAGVVCVWDENMHRTVVLDTVNTSGKPMMEWLQDLNNWAFGYLPGILGVLLGRMLSLDVMVMCMLGQLLGYALLCATAVRHAPRYKLTFFLLAMLPLNLFQACNVTYDAIVAAGMLLGVGLWLETLERPGVALPRQLFFMAVTMTLGTLAKPAYSLALLLLWMLPRERFTSKGAMWAFRGYVGFLTLWCMVCLILPGPYEAVLGGDARFTDSSSAGQIDYILSNPLRVLGVLADYSISSLPAAMWEGLAVWGDLNADYRLSRIYCLALLLICPLAAEGEAQGSPLTFGRRWKLAILGYLPMLGLMLAQYVVSTEIGADSIRGMQGRYVMPVLILFYLTVMLPKGLRLRQILPSRLITGTVTAASIAYMFWRLTVWLYLPIWYAALG